MKNFGNRDLIVRISADTAGMRRSIAQANKSLAEFGKTAQDVSNYVNGWSAKMAKWGLAIHGLERAWAILKHGIDIFTEMGNALKRVSERTGVAVSNLSALKYAAEQSGASFETLVDSMKTFQEHLGAAQLGDQGSLAKLEASGINITEYMGMDAEKQFKMLADHIASIPDKAEQARVAIQLFGNAGYELLPMFQQGSSGIDKLCEKAKELGYVMGDEDAENAKAMTQSINGLKNACTSLIREGLAAIAEPLINGINYMKSWVEWGGKFVRQHQAMIQIIVQTVKILAVLKMSLLLGRAIPAGYKLLAAQLVLVKTQVLATSVATSKLNLVLLFTKNSVLLLAKAFGNLLMKNPVGWCIAAAYAGYSLAAAIVGTSAKLQELSHVAQDRADSLNKESDAMLQKIERLQELSKYENLTNREQSEMKVLLDQLQEAGYNINQIYDVQTGKLKKVAAGYNNVKKAIREKEIEALREANREAAANIRKNGENLHKVGEGKHIQSYGSRIKEMNEISADSDRQVAKVLQNNARIRELEAEDTRDQEILAQRNLESGILTESTKLISSIQDIQNSRAQKGLSEIQKKILEVQKAIDSIDDAKVEDKLSKRLLAKRKDLSKLLRRLQNMQEEDERAMTESKFISDAKSLGESVQSMKQKQEDEGLTEFQKKRKAIYKQLQQAAKMIDSGDASDELFEQYNQLVQNLKILNELEQTYKKNEAQKEATQKKAEEEQKQKDNLQKIRDLTKQLEDASLSSSQKELKALKDINEELNKRLKTAQGLTKEEKAAAKKALADNEKRQTEFVQNRLDPAQAQYNLEMDHLQENLAREREEYLQALEKAKYDESNKDVQTAKKEMEQAEDAIRQQTLTGAQKEQEKAQEEYTEKLSNLNNALTDEDRLKATDEMEAARERLKNATERVYSLKNDAAQKKILEAGKKEQKEMAQMESRGTFSAYGLDSMVSSIPQQQLDYTKRIAMFVQSIFQGQQAEGVTV